MTYYGERKWKYIFYQILLIPLSLLAIFAVGMNDIVMSNGGATVFQDRVGDYFVSVSMRPPKPRPGLIAVSIVIEAAVSENGPESVRRVPISTDLTVIGKRRDSTDFIIVQLHLQSVILGISHFDSHIPVEEPGEWVLILDVTGPIGDIAVSIPFDVEDSVEGRFNWDAGFKENLPQTAVMIGSILIWCALVLGLVFWRRRRQNIL